MMISFAILYLFTVIVSTALSFTTITMSPLVISQHKQIPLVMYNSQGSDDNNMSDTQYKTRRKVIHDFIIGATTFSSTKSVCNAVMTDETTSFASPSLDSSYTQQSPLSSLSQSAQQSVISSTPTDEVSFTITKQDLQNMKGGLGLELGEVSFRTNFRVIVKSVAPNSLAEKLGIQPGYVVVSVNGADGERTNASGVTIYFSQAVKSALKAQDNTPESKLILVFRDPSKFRSDLENLEADGTSISTKVAPAGDTTQRYGDGSLRPGASATEQTDQVVTISQLIPPKMCQKRASTDDLLELSYIGSVLETGAIFDGSAVKINGEAIAGRGNDISVFMVLKKQPFGQFPPGWDVGLEGMCVGERRRLIIPPVLGYGSTGVPRRGIPPNATLQYDVTLVSINGLAIPQ